MKNRYRFTKPPKGHYRADNATLVPASLLPYKAHWQKIANNLPKGYLLIVAQSHRQQQRRILGVVAAQHRAVGKPVRVFESQQVIGGGANNAVAAFILKRGALMCGK